MSLTATDLSAACSASDTTLYVTSTSSGFPAVGAVANQLMQVDGEYMFITQVQAAGVVKVRSRGSEGTAAVAHDVKANVLTSSNNADFPAVPAGALNERPPYVDDIQSIGQNGTSGVTTIPAPLKNTTYNLTKATALATVTIGAPSVAQNGLRLVFTSQTAAAHVLTATTLLADGVSGSPHTTATFAAFKGASLTLEAANGLWNVIGNVGVTIS